jgi:hypothetical protein
MEAELNFVKADRIAANKSSNYYRATSRASTPSPRLCVSAVQIFYRYNHTRSNARSCSVSTGLLM